MSLTGNNSNSGTSGRSSIFETFHTPNFGDETFEVQPLAPPMKTYSHPLQQESSDAVALGRPTENPVSVHQLSAEGLQQQETTAEEEEEYAMDEEDDASSSENAETTLWMSCSPGRDLTDDEADEEWGESTSQEMDEMNEEQELGDEGKSSDEDEDDDDGVPLSKLAGKQFIEQDPIHMNVKHLKNSKKKKTATDTKKQIAINSKKKKMRLAKRSAYSFFYSDTQNAIKSQNPAATFGEISKIVASMWDHMESSLKEVYKQRADEYNTQHKDEIMAAAKLKSKKKKKSSSLKSKIKVFDSETPSDSLDSLEDPTFKDKKSKDVRNDGDDSVDSISISGKSKPLKEENQEKEIKSKPICNYTKCQNPAIDDPRWEYNYCSPQCVISHCKDVFNAWVVNRKSAYCET